MRVGFFIKAVPAIYHSEFDNWLIRILGEELIEKDEVFQIKASTETAFENVENRIIFNYEVAPFAVMYTNAHENFLQFLISMCGIIGGIFTIAEIIDSCIHSSSKLLFKSRINKLS